MNIRQNFKHILNKNKAQMELIEQFILVIFVIIGILILLFYLAEWKSSDVEQDKILKNSYEVNHLSKVILSSPLFTRRNKILDAAKITALNEAYTCQELRNLFNSRFILSIQLENQSVMIDNGSYVEINSNDYVLCNKDNYPDCNRWEICNISEERKLINENERQIYHLELPVIVNFYNDIPSKDKNNLATMYLDVMVIK